MRFTILGSTGFIGSHLKQHLCSMEDSQVICPMRGESLEPDKNYGIVFYCIGMTGDFQQHPMATVEAHVTYLKEVVTQMKFDQFVYLSSTRIYGQAKNTTENAALTVRPSELSDVYNISKIMGESICMQAGRPGVKVVRLSNVFDYTFSNPVFTSYLLNRAIRGKALQLQTHLDSAKDYITIDNVVGLLYKIAATGNQSIYNLANGVNVSHRALIEILESRFEGLEVDVATHPPMVVNQPIDVAKIRLEFDFEPEPFELAFSQAANQEVVFRTNENHN